MSGDFQNRLRKNLEHEPLADHPAPDVLNAYAEHVLPPAEAEAVTQHLSVCVDCREVVYLASAAAEEPATTVTRPAASHGVRWWSWAIPLAAVLLIGTTVMLSRLDRSQKTATFAQAKPEVAPAKTATPEATVAETTTEEKAPLAPKKKEGKVVRQVLQTPEPKRVPQVASENELAKAQVSGALTANTRDQHSMIALARSDKLENAPAAAAKVAAPAPAAPSFAPQSADETVVVTAATPTVEANSDTKELPKDAAARASESTAYAVKSGLYRAHKASVLTAWRVTGNFELQHSTNGQWQTVIPAPGTKMLTVSSAGNDVWAAGKNLALFHSADGGATWVRETIAGAKSADILHIEFSTALNGVVKTSAGEAFSTQDGGNTWVGVSTAP